MRTTLFGNVASKHVLNDFYRDSPLFKTTTVLLLDLIGKVVLSGIPSLSYVFSKTVMAA